MATFEELEAPIDAAIVNALISATPDTWKIIVLDLEFIPPPEGGFESVSHTISTPEGHRELVMATDEIFEQTFKLTELFKNHAKQWAKARYTVTERDDGTWHYAAHFTY
jgi:hypothetical protein